MDRSKKTRKPKASLFSNLQALKNVLKKEVNNDKYKELDNVKNVKNIKRAIKLAKEGQGIRTIKKATVNQLTDKQAKLLQEAIGGGEFRQLNTKYLNKKFFFNHRGGWFFDILINRNLKNNTDDTVEQYYGIFLNGNSGWVKAYVMPNKSASTINNIFHNFVNQCSNLEIVVDEGTKYHIKYPIKKIISDAEPGVPNQINNIVIQKIKQSETTHSALSRINAFASALRKRYKNKGYVSPEELNEFIIDWNNSKIPNIVCTRNEMMMDKELEEAYIASCLYHNQQMDDETEDILKKDDEVKIIEKNDKYIQNKQIFNQERTETYKIIENVGGNIKLQNVEDANDIRDVRANNISRKLVKHNFDWKSFFSMDDNSLHNRQVNPQVVVPVKRTPQQLAQNKAEAEIYKNAKSVPKARETIKIERGIENPKYRTRAQKRKEIEDLKKGEVSNETIEEKWRTMSMEEKKHVAEEIVKMNRDIEYDRGFVKFFSAEDYFNAIDKFLNRMSPDQRNSLLGELQIYDKKGKIKLGDKKKELLNKKLFDYIEKPEQRDLLQVFPNDIYAILEGKFSKNKPGQKKR